MADACFQGARFSWLSSVITTCADVQVTGEMFLEGGGEFKLYGFGRFNLTLWDKVIDELQPITERDTILVNFGAWYHRFFFDKGPEEYQAWQHDIYELLHERLKNYPAQVRA